MAHMTVRAKDLRVGDMFAHESLIGFYVIDMAPAGERIAFHLRAGRRNERIDLLPNTKVDIDR